MPNQPLCEVFGFPVDNFSDEAIRHRAEKLCPYNNQVPQCTKAKKNDPLGVCSMWDAGSPVIICPVRFRQNWRIIRDTGDFLVPNAANFDYVTEAKLVDAEDESVGKIDVVAIDVTDGRVTNYGALEIQAVYISGNIRGPFDFYMQNPQENVDMNWPGPNYPGPDWLSSIKRLEHQLIMKGSLFVNWNKRMAVAVQRQFFTHFRTMQRLPEVRQEEADMEWLLYNLEYNPAENRYNLVVERTAYYRMVDVLQQFSQVTAGEEAGFISLLEKKFREKQRRLNPSPRRQRRNENNGTTITPIQSPDE